MDSYRYLCHPHCKILFLFSNTNTMMLYTNWFLKFLLLFTNQVEASPIFFRTLNCIQFFADMSLYHRIRTLSGLFWTCQAPGLAAEVDPIAHFSHFPNHPACYMHMIRSRPQLNFGAGRDFGVAPEFRATRKQPIIPGMDLARNCNSGCANEILGCAKCHFWRKSPWNEIIGIILGCANGFIACAKHGWLANTMIPGNSRARLCDGEEDRVTWIDLRPG